MFDPTRMLRRARGASTGRSLKGWLGGAVLLLIASGLQFWNEGRTYRRDVLLADAGASVVSLAQPTIVASNEDRLVHFSGEALASAVTDKDLGIEVQGLALRRLVEMFQWREKKREREVNGRKTVTYEYTSEWSSRSIDSSRFEQAATHANPAVLPFKSDTIVAGDVRVGEFELQHDAIAQLGGWQPLAPDALQLPPNLAASFRADGDWLVTGNDGAAPAVGDVRLRFEVMPAGAISVLGRQHGRTLVAYTAASGDELLIVKRGRSDAPALLAAEASANTGAAWALRGAGFVLAWIGFGILLGPLAAFASVVPWLGRIAGVGVAIVSAALAVGLSLVVIGSGWLWQRPWLLGAIVIVLVFSIVWLVRRDSSAGTVRQPTIGPSPPPPPPASPPASPPRT